MREFGDLARKRVGVGVTPLQYQRYLDLRSRMGRRFSDKGEIREQGGNRRAKPPSVTRLVVPYINRAALISSIIENIKPAGFLVNTPFAAEIGTCFLVKVSLDQEGESADFPGCSDTFGGEHGDESQDRKDESGPERRCLEDLRPKSWLSLGCPGLFGRPYIARAAALIPFLEFFADNLIEM